MYHLVLRFQKPFLIRFKQVDPCLRCRHNGLACLMPRFEQVNRRRRPTCFECISAQNPHDSFICSFADLTRYPALQECPARVPRLMAVPLPSTILASNNRVYASDRQVPTDRPRRQGKAVETSSKKGKEKARARALPSYPEVKCAPSLLNDDDIGAQLACIEIIAPPIPQRDIGIGEAGPSNILRSPPSTSRPPFSLVPCSVPPSPPPTGDNAPFDPGRVIPSSTSCSPMPRYIPPSPSNDDEDEELVCQMLLDD